MLSIPGCVAGTGLALAFLAGQVMLGCTKPSEVQSPTDVAPANPAARATGGDQASTPKVSTPTAEHFARLARGGRLFDKWFNDSSYAGDFKPSQGEQAGTGGPNGNGTLNAANGDVFENTGHDYRLKNLFGWDLRGSDGIYGKAFHNKSYAQHNLLAHRRSEAELVRWLKQGDHAVPAFGAVLTEEELGDIAAFIVAVRDHALPQPTDIFELSASADKNYVLQPGGDPERGAALVDSACRQCHGEDGTKLAIDQKYSLGPYSRMKAYEAWLKVLNGHPGSFMGPQLSPTLTKTEQVQQIQDIFAALCDRTRYPAAPAGQDVADGDLRCGQYLR